MTKVCIKCKIEKDINEFGIRKNSKDGHHYYCKSCANAAIEEHYERHPEMLEVKKQRAVEYAIKFPEKVLESKRKCREKRKEKDKIYHRIKGREPKGRFRQAKWQAENRRGHKVILTFEEWYDLILQPCFYCGGKMNETGIGLDRLDSTLDYIIGNVVPCCTICNTMKMALSVEEFYSHIKTLIEYKSYQNWIAGK